MKKSKKGILMPPAIGYSIKVLLHLLRNNKTTYVYIPRLLIILLINAVNLPFRIIETWIINPKYKNTNLENAPIFILGHWRSGTTHLHNLLSQDPKMAYVTTYQSVFPDTLFFKPGRFLFRNFSRLLMPGTRNGDNVQLDPSLPQEEEFALGAKYPICFYYFWMYPKKMLSFYNSYIRFDGIKPSLKKKWIKYYQLLITKAIKNTGKEVFLSKNPSNTGRIEVLLKMYPNAKFIHIHRNPVEVYLSTLNFYKKMLPPLQLQPIKEENIKNNILEIYKNIMQDYLKQKELIPKENLIEVSFLEIEKYPIETLQAIYSNLQLNGFYDALPYFKNYYNQKKNYKKNTHKISKDQLAQIKKEWDFMFNIYDYSIPTNLEITELK